MRAAAAMRAMRAGAVARATPPTRRRRFDRFGAFSLVSLAGLAVALLATAVVAQTPAPEAASPAMPAGRIGFLGHNLFGTADGEFHDWRIVEQNVDLANPAASHAVVEVALASVDTKSKGRDDHLRTADFFDVEKFPVATVRGHSPQPLPPSKDGHPRHSIQLDVDLHGVKKTVAGEVEIVGTDPVVVEGSFTLLRTDFGVGAPPSRWNPAAIDDEVPVRFRIEFR